MPLVSQEIYDYIKQMRDGAATDADNYQQWGAAAIARRNQWQIVLDDLTPASPTAPPTDPTGA